jgi:hypothetical protein
MCICIIGKDFPEGMPSARMGLNQRRHSKKLYNRISIKNEVLQSIYEEKNKILLHLKDPSSVSFPIPMKMHIGTRKEDA